jgi:guanylate kinase
MTEPSPPFRRGRVFVIAAPSGAGKTSLLRALMAREPSLGFSVSYTTRRPRPNEVEGRDYHFVSLERFEAMIAAGAFVEHARVFDNYYGTASATVEAALAEGQDLVLEIDWQGAQQVRARLPEAHHIFILPPSLAALEGRLRKRSTDSDAVIARRLQDSVNELSHWREFDFVVINDNFELALEDLHTIVRGQGDGLRSDRHGLAEFAAALLGS